MPELQRQKRLEAIALDPDRIEREKRDRFIADRRALAEQYAARLFALDERTRRTIEAIANTPPVLVEEFAPSAQLPAPPPPDIGPWRLADGTPADGAHVDLPAGGAPTLSFTPAVFFSVLTPDCAGPAALATVLSARFSVRDDYYPAADYEVLLHADEAECGQGTWFGHIAFPQRSYPPGNHTIVYRAESPGVVGAQLIRRFSIAQLEAPPPPPPPRFHWTGAECVVAADGEYAALADCVNAHPPPPVPVYGWHWDGAQCVYAVDGEFGTKEQCQAAHPPPPPPPPPPVYDHILIDFAILSVEPADGTLLTILPGTNVARVSLRLRWGAAADQVDPATVKAQLDRYAAVVSKVDPTFGSELPLGRVLLSASDLTFPDARHVAGFLDLGTTIVGAGPSYFRFVLTGAAAPYSVFSTKTVVVTLTF